MVKHLAIFDKKTLEALLSGQKKIETRFSKQKIAPYQQISAGDLVYVKAPGDDISGQFRVKKVIFFDNLEQDDLDLIFKTWGDLISLNDLLTDKKYQSEKQGSRFGTLIFVGDSERFITSPIKIKKKDKRGWMVIE